MYDTCGDQLFPKNADIYVLELAVNDHTQIAACTESPKSEWLKKMLGRQGAVHALVLSFHAAVSPQTYGPSLSAPRSSAYCAAS